jgi:hypothetical protein
LDKNYLVPVGGAMVYSRYSEVIEEIGAKYAGRASIKDILNVFITLL